MLLHLMGLFDIFWHTTNCSMCVPFLWIQVNCSHFGDANDRENKNKVTKTK